MVKYKVLFTADLQNLTNLKPSYDPTFAYYFKMKCGNCGEPASNVISVHPNVKVDDSKNSPNLEMKCKFCERVGSVTVTPICGKPLTQALSVFRESAPLVQVDCKGFDPVEFVFRSSWKAKSIAGTKFEDIDLSDGDFDEYDEKGECPVSINNLGVTFEVMMSEMREKRLAWDKSMLERQRSHSARLKAWKKEHGRSSSYY
ncbi:Ribonuclease MRP protein subunit SNM1 [Heracleum sosnowskyi]|uniref:Ribonuclease MRP protein subunit SNM1 n=1 Tax=Heracleum sosnowskyi TaxID=360622 RepID=A0AAD8HIP8_9APIA|nr:Ribonuclease MRP protein subunit SNM1 [Heracleum sosnowskyi]